LTHVLGFNALTEKLIKTCREKGVMLIEDVCESHGATFKGKKVGTFGQISNFSFYYAHHMSTIEGGMICTDDEELYQRARMIRSHGMVREVNSDKMKKEWIRNEPELNPDFIFAFPSFNFRSTEINAVIGINQLERLDLNNSRRRENLDLFLKNLDGSKYFKEFSVEGSCNYAFTLQLRKPDARLRDKIEEHLRAANVEFRRGMSGGGNQLRQPYIRPYVPKESYKNFPNIEHVHFYGYYIGNYPDLEKDKILKLCELLNQIAAEYGS
jgi:CDP-6-deoxy-D-xylo-4-hexulose-3-dehydrase